MSRIRRLAVALVLCGCLHPVALSAQHSADAAAGADLSGIWLPDARRVQPWPESLPLAPATRRFMEDFDPSQSDPTTFCMPFGTPRNMLQTGYPLEIVQTDQRIVMVIQPNLANAEVRRIRLDGRAMPKEPEPSWYGTSRGHWEGATLVIETVGLREDALVSESGLPHSGQLRVVERLSVIDDPQHGRTLVDEIELHDPAAYLAPLKTRRYFAWAPQARVADSNCVDARWTARLWRERLEEHAAAAREEPAK